jgi:hypothetical protein
MSVAVFSFPNKAKFSSSAVTCCKNPTLWSAARNLCKMFRQTCSALAYGLEHWWLSVQSFPASKQKMLTVIFSAKPGDPLFYLLFIIPMDISNHDLRSVLPCLSCSTFFKVMNTTHTCTKIPYFPLLFPFFFSKHPPPPPATSVLIGSSQVVRASDCQCTGCNGPGFDPSIRRHSGIWGAADETVLNIIRKYVKNTHGGVY